jgi:hypothetical protein
MSLQSSSEFWDGLTFWLAGIGTILLFVSVVTGVAARRYARHVGEERAVAAERERQAHDHSIAKLNSEVSEANARLAEANLELERLRTPRTVSPEQQSRIAARLSKLVTEPRSEYAMLSRIAVVTAAKESEAENFARQIAATLRKGNWRVSEISVGDSQRLIGSGVSIEMAPDALRQEFWEQARAVATTFSEEGVTMSGPHPTAFNKLGQDPFQNVPAYMRIVVGVKS